MCCCYLTYTRQLDKIYKTMKSTVQHWHSLSPLGKPKYSQKEQTKKRMVCVYPNNVLYPPVSPKIILVICSLSGNVYTYCYACIYVKQTILSLYVNQSHIFPSNQRVLQGKNGSGACHALCFYRNELANKTESRKTSTYTPSAENQFNIGRCCSQKGTLFFSRFTCVKFLF